MKRLRKYFDRQLVKNYATKSKSNRLKLIWFLVRMKNK
jgi:hypothetical protein